MGTCTVQLGEESMFNVANASANYRNLGPMGMVTSLEGESYIQVVSSHCFDLRARARNIYAFYLLTR